MPNGVHDFEEFLLPRLEATADSDASEYVVREWKTTWEGDLGEAVIDAIEHLPARKTKLLRDWVAQAPSYSDWKAHATRPRRHASPRRGMRDSGRTRCHRQAEGSERDVGGQRGPLVEGFAPRAPLRSSSRSTTSVAGGQGEPSEMNSRARRSASLSWVVVSKLYSVSGSFQA